MFRPSYSELVNVLNNKYNTDSTITSRYTIVLATSKRARQLIDGAKPLTELEVNKPVSIAVKELMEGNIKLETGNANNTTIDESIQIE